MTDWNSIDNILIYDCACSAYDGGWRSGDRALLKQHFPDMTEDYLDRFCEALEIVAEKDAERRAKEDSE